MRGVLNDAISLYSADATLASAFVTRWCIGSKAATADGVFQMREAKSMIGRWGIIHAGRSAVGFVATLVFLWARQRSCVQRRTTIIGDQTDLGLRSP
jgi:hypothetical protein